LRRTLVSLALLVTVVMLAIAGCGGTVGTGKPYVPSAAQKAEWAAQRRAAEAQRSRAQADIVRRELREQAKEETREARSKAREHAEAIQRHREEAMHHHTYSAVFQASYLGSCAGGDHESTCACALVKAQERWSELEFEAQPTSALEAIIRECQSEGK
jgi:flagellar biosynthesis/type III secretory pathway protein FliH